MPAADGWTHREQVAVRYPDCDMQKVVFNAHYLAYCDLAMTGWLHEALGWDGADDDFDWMLVKVVVEWQCSATFPDVIDIDLRVDRWGTTSFDVGFCGTIAGRPCFTATITYVCVEPGGGTKLAVPDALRTALAP